MLGDNQGNPQSALPYQLFADWLHPSTGGRSLSHSSALLQQYQSRRNEKKTANAGLALIGQLGKMADKKIEEEFQRYFVFGAQMRIWRKGRIKAVQVFVDPFMPSLLWVSSQTKAFLFDLTYTTVQRFDLEIERASGEKHYFVLHYFQEALPIVFTGEDEAERNYELFSSYILHNRCHQHYPPYFSRIIKLYTANEARDSRARQRSATDVLKVSRQIGLVQEQLNWQVLQAIIAKTEHQLLTDATSINHNQIGQYFKILHCCEGVKTIFENYAGSKINTYLQYLVPLLTRENFQQFLIFEQKEDESVIAEILAETRSMISFYDFCQFLLSEKSNYVCKPDTVEEGLPLTDYFCYSSHNTYLSGNQLTSDSKVERYMEDLEGGVKCVEADVHNDGNRPIITHALNDKSLCKPIDFQETIHAIVRFTDHHPQHYPLILSLENHATEANRYKMLNVLFHSFANKLFLITSEDNSLTFKTLAELKGKVIIKTDSKINELLPFRKNIQVSSPIKCEGKLFTLPEFIPIPKFKNEAFRNRYQKFQATMKQFQARKEIFINTSPKQLYLPMAQMTKITGIFKSPTGVNNQQSNCYQCTSITNEKALKLNREKLIDYTKRSWLRIYPLGTEIASNNYNPIPSLQLGAQIIALNTQTKDSYAWLMMSYFTAGRSMLPGLLGYVPKPLHLRSSHPRQEVQKIYQIRICSSNEKVGVRFYGTESDMKANQGMARMAFEVCDYEQGFLMFIINDKFRQCVPLRWIRQGYRVLIAKNQMFRDSGIRTLIHITIKSTPKG